MLTAGLDLLSAQVLRAVIPQLVDVREYPKRFLFLNRTPMTPATDGEIIALLTTRPRMAAVIPDDAAAPVYGGDTLATELNHLANIKIGRALTQERIMLLSRISQNLAGVDETGYFTDWRNRTIQSLIAGVHERMEQMIIGAALDTYAYSKHGTIFTVGFGTPADLKVTKLTTGLWTAPTTATPITDIQTMQNLGREKYGVEFNRVTMNSVTFRQMIATTEFRNLATVYAQLVLPGATSFPTTDTATMQTIATRMLGGTIELYDWLATEEDSAGAESTSKLIPDGKVIFSSTAFDNNAQAIDFGNSLVTESMIGSLAGVSGGVIGQFPGPARGPLSYATAPPALNPPNLTLWAVARGFPRKFKKSCTAVLTVN